MIVKTDCRDCAHHIICAFRDEYKSAIDTISNIVNTEKNTGKHTIDSQIRISIECPHFMRQTISR